MRGWWLGLLLGKGFVGVRIAVIVRRLEDGEFGLGLSRFINRGNWSGCGCVPRPFWVMDAGGVYNWPLHYCWGKGSVWQA